MLSSPIPVPKVDIAVPIKGSAVEIPIQNGLFINNQFVPSLSGRTFPTINPANGNTICHVYEADKEDVDIAVRTAQKAFTEFRKISSQARGDMLYRLADLLEKNRVALAQLESLDNGKPFTEANGVDLTLAINCIKYYAGWADKVYGKVSEVAHNMTTITKKEPFGVVGQIIPWNFPILMMAWKIGPAIATGNCIVMKTSEKTPLSALKVCELIVEAGFPPGVINVLSGYGPTAGDAIARHPDIHKVAFTGSTETGKKIMKAAAESNLKKVSLELGGKSPLIIFPSADLDHAVNCAMVGIYLNDGQCCCAGSRIFVHDDVYDAFIAKFKEMTEHKRVGSPFEAETKLGPIVDQIQFDKVMGYIQSARAQGADVVTGGHRVGEQGYFIAPTVLGNVQDDFKVAKEEIFGPVACVFKFKTEEEVIARANATSYGLAAGIQTNDLSQAMRMTNAIEAGTVWVNTYNVLNHAQPFGGYKQSGIGRELGEYALDEYCQVKSVYIQH